MPDDSPRPPDDSPRSYVIHSDAECDRLERQAALAGIADHLRYLHVPPGARILDAGCGSGSMARLLAARHPDAEVVGADLRADYVADARERAKRAALANVSFEAADILRLPFPDGSFDLVWSKHLLQWVKRPQEAIAEMRRVTRPGGRVVCCNYDGYQLTTWPEDAELQRQVHRVMTAVADPFIGRKLAPMFMQAGLTGVEVAVEADRVSTIIGAIDPERRENLLAQATAARPFVDRLLGGAAGGAVFMDALFSYQDRPDTCSYSLLYFVSGAAPVG